MPPKSQRDPRKQAALRRAIRELLPQIVPVVREGGSVPLRSVVETIGGEKIESKVQRALDARGSLRFAPERDGRAGFENTGEPTKLGLKKIALKIPERLSGWAEVRDGARGVVLHFDKGHTIAACKALVCADVEAVELTERRIVVDLEGKAFDRTFDLGTPDDGREKEAQKEETPAPAAKEGAPAPRARGKKRPAAGAKPPAQETRRSPRPPRKAAKAIKKEKQTAAGPQAALHGALRDAESNIRSGVGKTLRSAAESQWAAKQAVQKASRDAKATIQTGVGRTREAAAANRGKLDNAAVDARSSARRELERSKENVRSRGTAARAKRASPRVGGGYLGLKTYPVRPPGKLADEQGAGGGLIVLALQPGSPADEAGLQLGDTLLRLDGAPLRNPGDLREKLSPDRIGQKMDATVLRAGKTRHLSIEVGTPRKRA